MAQPTQTNPIRRAREVRGLSQTDLALKLGLRQAMIEQIESGGSRAKMSHLDGLASLLGVSFFRLSQEYGNWWTAQQQARAGQQRRKPGKGRGGRQS